MMFCPIYVFNGLSFVNGKGDYLIETPMTCGHPEEVSKTRIAYGFDEQDASCASLMFTMASKVKTV